MATMLSLGTGEEPVPGHRLIRLLGRGGFGEVWEAEKAGGAHLALKFMPFSDSLSAVKELRAIQAVRGLKHPRFVHIDQVWSQVGYLVVAMELADGDLDGLLRICLSDFGAPIPPAQVCGYLTQAAEALDFLNARRHSLDGQIVGVQHCDIKPSNLLLFGESIKLCDFGLAGVTTSILKAHRRGGTLDYTAPEVFQGRLSDRTDQYALAVTYCKLRGARLPFPDSPATFDTAYVRPAPDLSMLSPKERPIIARSLARVPQDRWPTCGEMMAPLAEAAADQ
jgi:serine/threonine protein kinase